MTDTKVVEVRLDVDHHQLTEEQVFGLIRTSPGLDISVGLGYGGLAAAVVINVNPAIAGDVGKQLAAKAEELGLTVTVVEVLDTDEYESRGLAELEGGE